MNNQLDLSKSNDPLRNQRILFGALSGFIAGTIAALVSGYINTWIFPDLPFYIEWSSLFIVWAMWAILGGILAGIAAVSAEGWNSILVSALCIALTILVLNIMQSSEGFMLNMVSLLGLLLPFIAMMIPLAFIFFWLAHRFMQAVSEHGWVRIKIFLINIIIILALGMAPGMYAKMNARTERGVRIVHGILRDAPGTIHKALLKTEGFSEHANQPYTLSQASSIYSTVGVDVTAHYKDGYTLTCTVVLYPGSDPSVFPCKGKLP